MNTEKKERHRLLMFGIGELGGRLLDLILWLDEPFEILVVSRSSEALVLRTNLSRIVATSLCGNSNVAIVPTNVDDTSRVAEQIWNFKPHLIFNATSSLTYWKLGALPKPIATRIRNAGVGPWIPVHLSPLKKLMEAVTISGTNAPVVNGSYPDANNHILSCVGQSPAVGIGNIGNIISPLRLAFSTHFHCEVSDIKLKIIGHHSVSNTIPYQGNTGGAPYFISLEKEGQRIPVTDELANTAFKMVAGILRRTRGKDGMYVTAASALQVLKALLNIENDTVHAPGPFGLIGGYPVKFQDKRIVLDLPQGIAMTEAIEINKLGQTFDGIEMIQEDGTVVLTNESNEVMRKVMGFDQKTYPLKDTDEIARELCLRYANALEYEPTF